MKRTNWFTQIGMVSLGMAAVLLFGASAQAQPKPDDKANAPADAGVVQRRHHQGTTGGGGEEVARPAEHAFSGRRYGDLRDRRESGDSGRPLRSPIAAKAAISVAVAGDRR